MVKLDHTAIITQLAADEQARNNLAKLFETYLGFESDDLARQTTFKDEQINYFELESASILDNFAKYKLVSEKKTALLTAMRDLVLDSTKEIDPKLLK